MVDAEASENGFQNELSSPVAKKPKVEPRYVDSSSESTVSPSCPIEAGKNCCRQYIYDQFSVITYLDEGDWMQLECSSGEKCCRKQPKRKTEVDAKDTSQLDTSQLGLVSVGESGSHSTSTPILQKSQSLQLDNQHSRNPTVLKSSLSAGCLVQSSGENSSQPVTTKSVTFNLPPDHVDDRNTLGNGRLKSGAKKHQTEPDDDGSESEENDEAVDDSDDESSVSTSSENIGDPPLSKQVEETTTGDSGNVLAPLKTAELQPMAPSPSALSQPIAKYPMNPPPTVPKIPIQHHGAPLGFPPYPDPMQYPGPPGPFGTPMGPPPHLNGAPYLPHQMGPVPIHHHVLPQPPNGYLNPPPQHQHHPGFNQNQHYHMPAQPNGYRPGPNVPRNMGQVNNNRFMEESTSRGMYPKGPEFHQHLHSHLHQHMHYPPPANSSPNNIGVSAPVNQNIPLTSPVNKTTLIMAAQPKGKWCGLHGKIAFMIHLKKREKAEEHGKYFHAEVNSSPSIYPFPSLQPSRNSSFSVVPNSSSNFQQPPSMCNVPSNINRPMESMYPHLPYNPHVQPTLPDLPIDPKPEPWCVDGQVVPPPPPHMIPPGVPPGCHFGTVPVPTQHNPHAPISNYIPPPPPPQGATLPQG